MTLDELKQALSELGDKADAKATEIYKEIQAEKQTLDTETRREVRKFWIGACVVSFFIGLTFSIIL